MLINLKIFRIAKHLTQKEMADKCNVSRAVYSNIERGRNEAKGDFWENLQKAFDVPDSEMYNLMKKEEEDLKCEENTEKSQSN